MTWSDGTVSQTPIGFGWENPSDSALGKSLAPWLRPLRVVSCPIKIEVRLFATLTAYLPGGEGNAANMELPDGATLGDLVQMLAIPDDLPRVTLVNGRNAELDQRLLSGDVVTLFPPLAGGSAPVPA